MLQRAYASVFACAPMKAAIVFDAGATDGQIDIIAHRGASAYAPENTLAAFSLAIDMNAHCFELDCTLSKDAEVVVIHDDTIDRTTSFHGEIKDLNYHGEIDRYDAGTWYDAKFAAQRIPTLDQALSLARGRIGVYIEIKNCNDDRKLLGELLAFADKHNRLLPDHTDRVMQLIEAVPTRNLELTRKVIAAVNRRDMHRQIVLQSFSPVVCAVALAEAPNLRTELLAASDNKKPGQWPDYLRWSGLLNVAGFNPNENDVDKNLIRRLHADGKTVAVWAVNDENEMLRFAHMGVDAIITDRPDICAAVLADFNRV